jgi:hypothetical protein
MKINRLTTRIAVGTAALGLLLAATIVAAGPASATSPLDPYPPVLPDPGSIGIMGSPTNLIPEKAGASAVDIPGGSTNFGTQVATWDAVGAWNQKWQFTWNGTLTAKLHRTNSAGTDTSIESRWDLYLIVATSTQGKKLCLAAESPNAGARVVTAPCDGMDPLQLWAVLSTNSYQASVLPIPPGPLMKATIIVNAASIYLNHNDGSRGLIMTASDTLSGAYSKITMEKPQSWGSDTLISNQRWMIRNLNPAPITSSPPVSPQPVPPTCTGFSCVLAGAMS